MDSIPDFMTDHGIDIRSSLTLIVGDDDGDLVSDYMTNHKQRLRRLRICGGNADDPSII